MLYQASELKDVRVGEKFVFPDNTDTVLQMVDNNYFQDQYGAGSYVDDPTDLVWVLMNRS